jgi:hypothetical protein
VRQPPKSGCRYRHAKRYFKVEYPKSRSQIGGQRKGMSREYDLNKT